MNQKPGKSQTGSSNSVGRQRQTPTPFYGQRQSQVLHYQSEVLRLQHVAGNRAVGRLLHPEGGNTIHSGASIPPIVHSVLSSGAGQPLDTSTRSFMEARFGEDFSNVRVHTNLESVESATAANALAYAIGSDIVFAPGFSDPETTAGKQLLAHELTHVVQQGRGEGISAGLVHEHEAEDVSRRLWSSPKVFVRTRSQRGIPQYAHDPNRSTTLTDDNLLQMLNRFPKGEDITLYHVDREGGFSQSARRSGRNFKLRAGELWLTTNVEA